MAGAFGDEFLLTLITENEALAAEADAAGVDRVGVDLESMGKLERQAGQGMRLSGHTWEDLRRKARVFARLNPVHDGTRAEVDRAIELGAHVLMLPNFRTAGELEVFVEAVRGRARVIALVETAPAVNRIREILAVGGVDEVMVGLNDLHLELGARNHFQVLASPLMEQLAAEVRRTGIRLGIGGVGRVDDASLPVPVDVVYAQYPRLGATAAWLSRSFVRGLETNALRAAVAALRERLSQCAAAPVAELERMRRELVRYGDAWVRAARD
jgi:hypothetical protein